MKESRLCQLREHPLPHRPVCVEGVRYADRHDFSYVRYRWRRAGVWARIITLAGAHDAHGMRPTRHSRQRAKTLPFSSLM